MPGKRPISHVAVCSVLALSTLLPAATASATHTSDEDLRQTRRELRAARTRLAQLVRTDRELLGAMAAITRQLRSTQASLRDARLHLTRIGARLQAEERRLRELEAQRRARAAAIDGRARQLYILGPGFAFQSFFEAEDYGELVARNSALEYLSRFDRATIEELAILRQEARRTREALVAQRRDAAAVRDEIAHREAIQRELLSARREVHDRLSSRIDAQQSEVRDLEREQARILALIRSRQSTSTGPVSTRGFVWPIRGRVTSEYGPRWGGYHTGIDIDCRTGDPIGASKAGRVIVSGWQGGYGRAIVIDHGNGVTTLYAHMSRLYVSEGTSVSRSQRIGACGETGRAYGDHLHFEVRVNGQHQNPRRFLP